VPPVTHPPREDTGERGLRLDAVRNQERIVAAAAAAFAELGAEATLDEVARRAGVGVATVYRRFGNRDQLLRAVVEHVLAVEVEPVAEVETDDPWRDLAATLEASVAAVAGHRKVVALAHATGGLVLCSWNKHVSDFSGGPGHSSKRLTVQNDTRPHTRPNGEEDEVLDSDSCA